MDIDRNKLKQLIWMIIIGAVAGFLIPEQDQTISYRFLNAFASAFSIYVICGLLIFVFDNKIYAWFIALLPITFVLGNWLF